VYYAPFLNRRLWEAPVALGEGTSLFAGLPEQPKLNLAESKKFKTGIIMLLFKPAES
jgi:hypothetical protein